MQLVRMQVALCVLPQPYLVFHEVPMNGILHPPPVSLQPIGDIYCIRQLGGRRRKEGIPVG